MRVKDIKKKMTEKGKNDDGSKESKSRWSSHIVFKISHGHIKMYCTINAYYFNAQDVEIIQRGLFSSADPQFSYNSLPMTSVMSVASPVLGSLQASSGRAVSKISNVA